MLGLRCCMLLQALGLRGHLLLQAPVVNAQLVKLAQTLSLGSDLLPQSQCPAKGANRCGSNYDE